jgi:glutaredoxin 3
MDKKIRIYTSPICATCEMAKKFFKEQGIEYEEIDVFKNKEKAKEIMEKTGEKRVPIIEIDKEFFSGFDKEKIRKVLEK